MHTALSIFFVLSFVSSEPAVDLPPQVRVLSPSAELPANGKVFFAGDGGPSPTLTVSLNGASPAELPLDVESPFSSGVPGTEAIYSLNPNEIASGDTLQIDGALLESPLSFSVVEEDTAAPTLDENVELVFWEEGFTDSCFEPRSDVCAFALIVELAGDLSDEGGLAYAIVESELGELVGVSHLVEPSTPSALLMSEGRGDRTLCFRMRVFDVAENETATEVACYDIIDDAPAGNSLMWCSGSQVSSVSGAPPEALAALFILAGIAVRRRRAERRVTKSRAGRRTDGMKGCLIALAFGASLVVGCDTPLSDDPTCSSIGGCSLGEVCVKLECDEGAPRQGHHECIAFDGCTEADASCSCLDQSSEFLELTDNGLIESFCEDNDDGNAYVVFPNTYCPD